MLYARLKKHVEPNWVLADTHFNHRMLEEHGHRPVRFTELLLRNCAAMIKPKHLTVFLGDVIIGQASMLAGYMKCIPGYKILVRGNHDQEKRRWYLKRGFDFVCDSLIWRDVYMTHEPAFELPEGCRVNLHGHLHTLESHRWEECKDRMQPWHRLFSLEVQEYKPVPFRTFVPKAPPVK